MTFLAIRWHPVAAAVLAASLFVGCAGASSRIIIAPDGSKSVRVTCHPDITDCWEKAGDVCHGPYDVVSQSQHPGGTIADWQPGPVTWYNVIVRCR